MKNVVFQLEPFTCPSCIKKIETALTKTSGVDTVKVLFNSGKVKAAFDEASVTAEELETVLQKLGYPVLNKKIS